MKNKNIILFSLISFFALCIRLLSYPKVSVDGTILPIAHDSYYHMRRILYTSTHFPDSITFDTYINYPYGSEIGWPLLYDQAASLFALFVRSVSLNTITIERAVAFFPLLLGILTFIPVYYAASKLFNKNVGLLSVLVIAILPVHIRQSLFGMVDHHIAEILLSTTAFAFYIAALKCSNSEQLALQDLKEKIFRASLPKSIIFAAFAGVFLAVSLVTWLGSPIFIGIIVIYTFVQFTVDIKENRSSEHITILSSIALLVTLILIIPYISLAIKPGFEISAAFLSWFHVLFVLSSLLFIFVISMISRVVLQKSIIWWSYPLMVCILGIISAFLIQIIQASLFSSIMSGISYLLRGEKVLGSIIEAQPLFSEPGRIFTIFPIWDNFSITFFFALGSFMVFIWKLKKEHFPPEKVFFLIWILIILSLTLSQRRFTYLLSVNIAILTGYFIMIAFTLLSPDEPADKRKKKDYKQKKGIPRKKFGQVIGIIVILEIVIIPNLIVGISAAISPVSPPIHWQESMNWLRNNTPETSDYNPKEIPEYGVLSWWDNGNRIVYLGDRPVVSNNFQTGVEDTARFFIEKDESDALSILDKRKVRYIITEDLMLFKFRSVASLAGKDPDNYRISLDEENGKTTLVTYSTSENESIESTMLWSLHVNDGFNLAHFRLVYESNLSEIEGLEIRSLKIFEYVKGAKIEGFASPDDIILAQTNVTSNRNRTFTYLTASVANETGWYRMYVPYSSYGTDGTIHSDPYTIKILNSNISENVPVSEDDIINGRNIRIDLKR